MYCLVWSGGACEWNRNEAEAKMKHKPIKGQKVAFQFQGKDGEWYEFLPENMNHFNIEIPDTSEIDEKYKAFLDSFTEKKCFQATMRAPTAQDDLILDVMLFGDKLDN